MTKIVLSQSQRLYDRSIPAFHNLAPACNCKNWYIVLSFSSFNPFFSKIAGQPRQEMTGVATRSTAAWFGLSPPTLCERQLGVGQWMLPFLQDQISSRSVCEILVPPRKLPGAEYIGARHVGWRKPCVLVRIFWPRKTCRCWCAKEGRQPSILSATNRRAGWNMN